MHDEVQNRETRSPPYVIRGSSAAIALARAVASEGLLHERQPAQAGASRGVEFREALGALELLLGRRVAQVDVLVAHVLLHPVIGDPDVLVAGRDGVDGRPLLGGDVVANEQRRRRHDG